MSTLIVRTNPTPTPRKPMPFACSICGEPKETFDEGVACAEKNYKDRTGMTPAEREAV
jgi:hypothetical protein